MEETEIKKSRKTSVINLTTCKQNKVGAEIIHLKQTDLTALKNLCSGEVDSENNRWAYADNILTLKDLDEQHKSFMAKFSVSDQGDNKIKLSLLVTVLNEGFVMDWSNYYVMLQKQ